MIHRDELLHDSTPSPQSPRSKTVQKLIHGLPVVCYGFDSAISANPVNREQVGWIGHLCAKQADVQLFKTTMSSFVERTDILEVDRRRRG
jgi:hypothetical protein